MYCLRRDLPDLMIGDIKSIPILSLYRKVLSHSLLEGGRQGTLGSRYDPILSLVPAILEMPDMMQFLVQLWEKRYKGIPQRDKVL